MTETEEFLEQLTDPLRYGVRKAAMEFYHMNNNQLIIKDLRIRQVNELPYYEIELKTDKESKHFPLHNDMLDMLDEYVPSSAIVMDHTTVERTNGGSYIRMYYICEQGHWNE